MVRKVIATGLVALALANSSASAQTIPSTPESDGRRTTLWTILGAGAGFGVGIWGGLHVFDDAVNSDRKVWTTAILSAAAGGILGYVLTRGRSSSEVHRARKAPAVDPLTPREFPITSAEAPILGTGAFRSWLEQPRFRTRSENELRIAPRARRPIRRLD